MSERTKRIVWGSVAAVCVAAAPVWGQASLSEGSRVLFDGPDARAGDEPATLAALLEQLEGAAVDDPRIPHWVRNTVATAPWVSDGVARAEACLAGRTLGAYEDARLSALALLRRQGGDAEGASAAYAARGLWARWWVVGRFGLGTSSALSTPYEPERAAAREALAPDATFDVDAAQVGWRAVEARPQASTVDLGEPITAQGAALYAVTHARFETEAEGYLVVTGPSMAVWVNRVPVATIDRQRSLLPPELWIPVRVRAGWNRVLLKVAGGASASVRFVADGAAVAPVEYSLGQSVEVGAPSEGAARWAPHLEALRDREDAEGRALEAQALLVAGLPELALEALEQVGTAFAGEAWWSELEARVWEAQGHVPQAVRRDRVRGALEAALEVEPERRGATRRLLELWIQDERVVEAIGALEGLIEAYPDDVGTRLRLASLLLEQGWWIEAERAWEGAAEVAADVEPVLELREALWSRRGRDLEAQEVRERIFAIDRSEGRVFRGRLQQALAQSDRAAAEDAVEAFAAYPWSTADGVWAMRLQVAQAFGGEDEVLGLLRARLAERPWDMELQRLLASRLIEGGAEGSAAWNEASELLAQIEQASAADLRAQRLRLGLAGREDRFWERWEPDLARVLAGSPDASNWPQASTVCLFDQTVSRIYPDGSSDEVVHQVWRILDEAGIQRYGERPQAAQTLTVRTITADGQVLEPIRAGGAFQMPGLAPGAVVEHSFRVQRDAPWFQYENGPFYFMDPDLTEPFWFSRWVICVHRDAPVELIERNMDRPGITKQVREEGPWRITTYTATNQPRVEPEAAAPARQEFLPWVRVLERRSLDEVGEFYRERAQLGTRVTPTIRRAAEQVCAEVEGALPRARALYRFVQEHVRGQGQSQDATQVLASRAGSKTLLYAALLEAAEVPFHMVAAGSAPWQAEPIEWAHPEVGQLRSLLVRIEPAGAEPVYVYCDLPRLAPFGALPVNLWGAPGYVCDLDGGELVVLPQQPWEDLAQRRVLELSLQAGGGVRFELSHRLPDLGLYEAKEVLQTLPERQIRGFFAAQANEVFTGARVASFELPELTEVGRPLEIRYAAQAPQAVRGRGERARLGWPLGRMQPQIQQQFGSVPHRLFDLVIREPTVLRDEVWVDLGPYACTRLPEDVALIRDFGQYSLSYARAQDGRIRIRRALTIPPGRVEAGAYAGWVQFFEAVDDAERQSLSLVER